MTKLMGILNVTSDSFFDKSRALNCNDAIDMGIKICKEGADIIDIGGESTRPGSFPVEIEDELNRVIPVIQALKNQISIPISIDSRKPEVAAKALAAGASLLNDVSGFEQAAMREIAASANVDVCVMHMQGNPQNMQNNPHYPEGIIDHLMKWFEVRINEMLRDGIKEKSIIIDPGIGFGKTVADNLEIIHNLPRFKSMGFRVLMGISRKTFLRKILQTPTEELLPSTIAVNTLLILDKVDVIRVHDVKEHRQVIDILKAI